MDKSKLFNDLRDYRAAKQMSMAILARKLGVTRQHLTAVMHCRYELSDDMERRIKALLKDK